MKIEVRVLTDLLGDKHVVEGYKELHQLRIHQLISHLPEPQTSALRAYGALTDTRSECNSNSNNLLTCAINAYRSKFNYITQKTFHRLQLDYAKLLLAKDPHYFAVVPGGELEAALNGLGSDSHLLQHSNEGYFIPHFLTESSPLFDEEGLLPGSWLGSSERLVEELVELSQVYGIEFRQESGKRALKNPAISLTKRAMEALQNKQPQDPSGAWFMLYATACQSVSCKVPMILVLRS